MGIRVTELHCKEVICVSDGRRLGFVSDVEILIPEGRVLAILVPGPCRFMGVLGRQEDYVIPWNAIRRVGDDIILIDCKVSECRCPRPKPSWFRLS